ncbi:hypothetical protein LPE509_02938 [Legionella pneumophila subsp. pneumophila LPE509]|nr:hypothetical protein LPE509_02938 [Legionella pneumophila subsp. pneumophila LPE509]
MYLTISSAVFLIRSLLINIPMITTGGFYFVIYYTFFKSKIAYNLTKIHPIRPI